MAPEESQHNENCEICDNGLLVFDWGLQKPSKQKVRKLARSLSERLFHQFCERCSVASNSDIAINHDLCAFCQHLRLGHLLCCVEPNEWPMENTLIKFCELQDVSGRTAACSFCHLILRAGLPYGYFSGMEPLSSSEEGFVSFLVREAVLEIRIQDPQAWRAGNTIHFRGERARQGISEEGTAEQPAVTLGSTLGAYFDWGLTAHWLADCYENHKECNSLAANMLPPSFRVIDVNKRYLVQSRTGCSFVALSYVWGQRPDPTKLFTVTSNIDMLRIPGALSPSALPRTVNDAVEACRRLGEQYLWVDRFCIIQDSPTDKAEQIAAMAAIYSCSKFALIVADGDSDSGIAGVGHARTYYQPPLSLPSPVNLTFAAEPAGWRDVLLGSCVWSTRGWTYQESVLPRRKVYLTEAQAFFECVTHIVSEDGSTQPAMYSASTLRPQPWAPRYEAFNEHLVRYRERKLTNKEDVYNAIDGIASALYPGTGALWRGLPRQEFDETLLWCWSVEEGSKYIWDASSPSWSWSSMDRGVGYLSDVVLLDFTYCDTLVSWKGVPAAGGSVESVRVIPGGKALSHFRAGEDECGCQPRQVDEGYTGGDGDDDNEGVVDDDIEQLLFAAIAWNQGCIDRPCPFQQPRDTTWKALRSEIRSRWACPHRYWQEALQEPADLNDSGIAGLGTGTIFASVQFALFGLRSPARPRNNLGLWGNKLCITDSEGQTVGLLVARDGNLGVEDDMVSHGTFEFIALSVSKVKNIVLADGSLKDVDERDLEPPIETSGDQICGVDTSVWSRDEESREETCLQSTKRGISQPGTDEGSQGPQYIEDEPERCQESRFAVRLESPSEIDPLAPAGSDEHLLTPDSESDQGSQTSSKRSVRPLQAGDWEYDSCGELPSLEELQKLTFWDKQGDCLFPIPAVNVMMIMRNSDGFSRRVSVGWIYLKSWLQAKPKFETIYLK